jgi:N-acetylglutamate synthase-like GNAT family acetyltransferase
MNLSHRKYQLEDREKCLEIHDHAVRKTHAFLGKNGLKIQRNKLESDLANPDSNVIIIERYGKPIGFASYQIEGETLKLRGLFVELKSQKKGSGTFLMKYFQENHKGINLAVFEKNQGGIEFYEKKGFLKSEPKLDDESKENYLEMTWQSSEE